MLDQTGGLYGPLSQSLPTIRIVFFTSGTRGIETAASRRFADTDDDCERGEGLLLHARGMFRNRVRGTRQLIVAQSADDILDRVVDPSVRDVIAMRHVG
jgi:hypothetical protein